MVTLARSETIDIRPKRHLWLMSLSPALLALAALEWVLAPGKAFYSGRAEALAVLVTHGDEIFSYLILGMMLAAAVALLVFVWRMLTSPRMARGDSVAAAVNIGVLAGFFAFTLLIGPASGAPADLVGQMAMPGHLYYLDALPCYSANIDCESNDFYRKRYAVIDCPSDALTCRSVFLSEPLGPSMIDLPSVSAPGKIAFQQSTSGGLHLVFNGRILWQTR